MTVIVFDDGEPGASSRIAKSDVREDTYRSSGPGGQHRNKTDSAVRLTHLPTGIVVTATEERSQHLNRLAAWQRLEARLAAVAEAESAAATNGVRREQLSEFRSWTWCGWRDEVKGPDGRRGSMKRLLSGNLRRVL